MKKITIISQLLLTVMLLGVSSAYAQFGNWLVSPQVNPDNSVTFRYLAPGATTMELSAQFLSENLPMTKGEGGVWSVTTPPVTPDLYPYNFVVDSITSVNDPNNVLIFPNERFKGSLVDVQGQSPLMYSVQDVPHGKVTHRFYKSSTLGDTRPLVVYTPAGYNPQDAKTYPVLYLIHGATDTHETWYKVGRMNFILDNLIASGAAEPMIVVMPYANTGLTYQGSVAIAPPADKKINLFNEEITKEIIPYVEKNYKVVADAGSRAIAGFSRGGRQTLDAGLTYPDVFSYVCGFAPAANVENLSNGTYASPDQLKQLNLLWLSCGVDDFLYQRTQDFAAKLDELGIPHEDMYTPGGHTWMNCRIYLNAIAPKLFKK
ncbi:MAG: esterase [Rikenellaceae bacterium]|jgi:enterochelin esterase family protein|nr:esterase [Rikenellaceae bacterium]